MGKIKKILKSLKDDGLQGFSSKLGIKREISRQAKEYGKWVEQFDILTSDDRQLIQDKIAKLSYKPLISILLPVYNVEERWLRLCLMSVVKQLYPNWELCVADDYSSKSHIRNVLEEFAAQDNRIKLTFRTQNGHISAASNSALQFAAGEFTALLDHDDELSEHALYLVAEEINHFPNLEMIYSDEDMLSEEGKRYKPKFKPDFSLDLLYSLNLITHLAVYRTDILRQIGGFRIGLEGSQDYDLALRYLEQISEKNIRHIPHILYHWRAIFGSVALSANQKSYAHTRARRAIKEHLERRRIKAKVVEGAESWHRVLYDLPEDTFISVIASSNLSGNIENVEFIKITNTSAEFFNSAAQNAKGDVLIFVENSIKPVSKEWIKELAGFAKQKEIGAVSGKILFPDQTIRHNGIVLGINENIGFAFRKLPKDVFSDLGRTNVINNFSAVSGVLAVRRELFEEIGGFDETNFNKGLFDIDFCLRLREKNYRIVFTPYAEFVQTEDSATEKTAAAKNSDEVSFFKEKWRNYIEKDEFYNPNLSLQKAFSIATPPRLNKPWKD